MALKTYEGKAIIEVDYLTHAGEERALDAFNKWIKTANQWALGVNVVLPPEFIVKPKENKEENSDGNDKG